MSSGRTGKVKRNWKWAENDTYENATDKDCELIVDVSTHIWYITSKINWLQRFRCGASPDAFCTFCYRNISIEKKLFFVDLSPNYQVHLKTRAGITSEILNFFRPKFERLER